MMRPFTLITMLLAALSGAYLFAVKHRAQVLDNKLAATAENSRLDAQRIRVLQAQWALEIDPTRLAKLAAQFTSLQPMQPAQLVAMAALAASLPPAGAPPPGGNPPGAPDLVAAAPEALAANGLPYPPPAPPGFLLATATAPASTARPPVQLAVAAPPRVAPRQVQIAPGRSALHLAQTRLVETLPAPRPLPLPFTPMPFTPLPFTPAAAAARAPVSGGMAMPAAAPAGAPLAGARLVSAKATADEGGSALGMAADLAPPQPLPSDGSGTGN